MKTPKRYMNKPLPMLPEDNVVVDWVIEIWCARAKRKNRIAQLKRTIARLNRELIIDALQALAEHGDADIKRACINTLADFAK